MSLQTDYQMTIIAGVFQAKLNPQHDLLILAGKIDWERIADELAPYYSKVGRNGKPIRLMVGAHVLKHMHDISDAEVVERLCGDVYWMAFCGIDEPFSTEGWRPLDSSTMTYFRKRIGAQGMRIVEAVIRDQLLEEKRIASKTQFVDSTAMEKNVAYPTDTDLLDKGRRAVVAGFKKLKELGRKIKVGQTFGRKARKIILDIAKLGRNRQERIKEGAEQLIEFARSILNKVPKSLRKAKKHKNEKTQQKIEKVQERIELDAQLLERIIEQTEARYEGVHIKNKVYSFHEPQVTCISKGKRSKPNEYGSKVSISVDKNGFVVDHDEYDHNLGDSQTLERAVDGWAEATGRVPKNLAADRGYHSPEFPDSVREVKRIAIPRTGRTKHPHSDRRYFKKLQRKRPSIESVISHLKQDHRMNRCRYKRFEGDRINVSLAVTAWNAKKWMRQMSAERRKSA
jgi:IS5 family transposase